MRRIVLVDRELAAAVAMVLAPAGARFKATNGLLACLVRIRNTKGELKCAS